MPSSLGTVRAEQVDLEIVLAMDGSGSINRDEFILQLNGTAAAFRDPSIQQAILSGPIGKIAVAVMIWADAAFPKFETGWFVLDSGASANHFSDTVLKFHRHSGRKFGIGGGGTGIGDGIAHALEMIRTNDHSGLRKVVDVSGDGIETDPWFKPAIMLPQAKRMADREGVTVNGLAILNDFPYLDMWYRKNVITGPGSFVIEAKDFSDFGRAIHEKLWREISSTISDNRDFDSPVRFSTLGAGNSG